MFAKVFAQIFDSSIAENYQVRLVFEDFLKLADSDGVVDMTHEAICRRTNVPLEIVKEGIAILEAPDPRSRTPDFDGRRIIRLDQHRDWGWRIVNYTKFREIRDENGRREYRAKWMREKRAIEPNYGRSEPPTEEDDTVLVNNGEHVVNSVNPSEPRQKQRQKQKKKEGVQGAPHLPLAEVFDCWNACGLTKTLVLSDKRRQILSRRLKDPFFIQNWQSAIAKASQSKFCQGINDRGWKADFDWFIRPDTCAKIMEGRYANQAPRQCGSVI